jgi:hypothetical protein
MASGYGWIAMAISAAPSALGTALSLRANPVNPFMRFLHFIVGGA